MDWGILEYLRDAEWLHYLGCGFLGAFLIVAADHFVRVGLALKDKSAALKILYVVAGGAAAFGYSLTPSSVLYVSVGVGAGWPYPIIGAKNILKTYSNGRKLKALDIDTDTLIEAVKNGRNLHEDSDDD